MLHAGMALHSARYCLLSLLRRSSNSSIWRAFDARLQREVALKAVILEEGGGDAAEREAEAAVRVQHPSCVQVYGVFTEGGYGFIAMELAQGNLLDLVERHGPPQRDAVLGVARDLAAVLAVAHAAGVVHRDLKPQNVLIRLDGSICLGDFGIAQVHARGRTRTGAMLGTLPFMAPEQRRDARAVCPATDVYAWAVLVAWLRTGTLPGELYVASARGALEAALRAAGEADGALLGLLLTCGSYSPGDRPADGAALCGAFDGALGPSAPYALPGLGDAAAPPNDETMVSSGSLPGVATRPAPLRPWGWRPYVLSAVVAAVTSGALLYALTPLSREVVEDSPGLAAYRAWEALPFCADSAERCVYRTFPNRAADGRGLEEAAGATVADLDGDGALDLVIPHTLAATTRVWWGPLPANGWFETYTDIPTGRAVGYAAVGDLTGDGQADIAHVLADGGGIVVQPMAGRAVAGEKFSVELGVEPYFVAIDDWDQDGQADLLVAHRNDNNLVLLRRTGRDFGPPIPIAAQIRSMASIARGGLVVDGVAGLRVIANGAEPIELASIPIQRRLNLMASGSGVIVLGDGPEGYSAVRVGWDGAVCRYPRLTERPSALADMNKDGRMDIVEVEACGYCTSSYRVCLGG